jgi:hypothetical protein
VFFRSCSQVHDVDNVTVSNPILVEEGGEARMMEFKTYLPPEVMCFEPGILNAPIILVVDVIMAMFNLSSQCNVQIQMSTSNYMYDVMPYFNLLNISIGRPK